MAFGTICIRRLGEGLFTIMTNAAMFVLAMFFFGHFQIFFFHFENFGVAIGAFRLVLAHVRFMAEKYRTGASFGFKFYIPTAHLFPLSVNQA
jgi:uncharacterized membrane protein YvlD (DUF360 family)